MKKRQISRGTRLPEEVSERIEKIANKGGYTVSQFLRRAAINELRRVERART